MASLTDAIAVSNQAPVSDSGPSMSQNLSQGVQAGVQLATAQEQVQATKQKVQEQQMELQQKQGVAIYNRTKAAMYAPTQDAFNRIMQGNKSYANAAQIPYDDEGLSTIYKDPIMRANLQKELSSIDAGHVSSDPKTVLSMAASIGPEAFSSLSQQNQANATIQNKQDFEMKKTEAEIAGKADVANIVGGYKQKAIEANAGKTNDKTLLASGRAYDKDIKPFENLLAGADKIHSIIHDVETGGISSNPNIKADIEDALSQLSSGHNGATVSGSARHEIDSLYGKLQKQLNTIEGTAGNTIAPEQLAELKRDEEAFKKVISRQHEYAFDSFLKRQPDGVQGKLTDSYNSFRSSYGLVPKGGGSPGPASTQQAPPAIPSGSNPAIEAKLKSLPAGVDPDRARAALIKAAQTQVGIK
jgi:hypothetical protein